MTTVGVEEEYLLLDPVTGLPVPQADKVRTAAGLGRLVADQEVQYELLQAQVEVATPVCATLEEIGGHLLRLRHAIGMAAEEHGCRIAACGTPPLRHGHPMAVTDQARYRAMVTQAPQLVAEQLVNGTHVHVAVPDREAGVQVLNRVRAWLPTLTAMSANSPLWDGGDTGFASWRTVVFGRWPVSGMPPYFHDAADYDLRVQRLLDAGLISDTGQLYWQARLSPRYPTVEVRCFDVQLSADEAVMLAAVTRALVETALAETAAGARAPDFTPELLQAAMWHAARHGLGDTLVGPGGATHRAGDVLYELLRHVSPALDASGDSRQVTSLIHRLLRNGTGADRQRAALARGGLRAVTDLVSGQGTGT
ncbi:carboxylate-amine ligase [Streptomyces viridochromogenes DSM 40736]|uniref:Putative glutamate--cysteine ligase 2 n=1 Tax=Streptomyces viridochromogenes (strain DSM 40736 / JCM 4977 / BCRC 1201 / Tue 494) TaxID=591159 RepID=D9XET1_STRVT|nr:glutamate--cysteine ligase [Streptomyces viridochromogenes]EFL36879.1 carboxylate-amine ligase [Streptomyces viridochromogenes DSM 40736]